MGRNSLNLLGQKFHKLTVVAQEVQGSRLFCFCECDCGGSKRARASHLQTGNIKSCGCARIDAGKERRKHGAAISGKRHPLYVIWSGMISRCYRKKDKFYDDYGGRGIKICKEWHIYTLFRDYMLALPNCPDNAEQAGTYLSRQIDRKNNDKGYAPGNVKWSTRKEQANNKRSNNVVRVNGVQMSFSDAVTQYGKAPYDVIWKRVYKYGWPLKKAFLTKIDLRKSHKGA